MSLNWNISDSSTTTARGVTESKSATVEAVSTVPLSCDKIFTPSIKAEESTENGESGTTTDTDDRACTPKLTNTNDSGLYSEQASTLSGSTNVDERTTSSMAGIKTDMQPLHSASANNTVSAAADSSDNQPPTPTPDHQSSSGHHHHQQQQQQQQQHNSIYSSASALTNSNQQMYQEIHSYHPPTASYHASYEQFYHAPPAGMDYGSAMQQLQQAPLLSYQMQNQSLASTGPPHDLISAQRYHPYINNGSLHQSQLSAGQNSALGTVVSINNGINSVNNASSSVSNSSLSPRVVSSSSPSQNNSTDTSHHNIPEAHSLTNRTPTPSASKQCNKCGMMCATETELNEHYSTVHGTQSNEDCITTAERSASSASERQYHPFGSYIKEEPPTSDILDLDSQKMVYPQQPGGDVNPGLHTMQRPMAWQQEMHPNYMAAPHLGDNKNPGYYEKQDFSAIKNDFHTIKAEYTAQTNFVNAGLKTTDYGTPIVPQTRPDEKPFTTTDLAAGNNPVSSSPSEFPSTTTPQENLQYRGFEPPSSSLPSSGVSTKATTWKSNEARRPKTYNCTACNKWFTSSGHLKRHYNTTLHKNAVKSSGLPDPATLPISAHHHPSRDPNSKHHRNSQSRQPPPIPIPPEAPRSPDFSSQYTAQSPNGFPPQNQQQSQAFQYHPQGNLNSSVNGHPNGLAGPSVQPSQPRGLLNISNIEVSIMDREEDQLHNISNSSTSTLSLSGDQYLLQHQQQHHQQQQQQHQQLEMPNNSPNNNNNSSNLEDYHQSTINLQHQQQSQQRQLLQLQSPHITSYQELLPIHHHHQEHPDHTIFNTATTIHNIMDQQQQPPPPQQQQQYINNHLGISTTTPITLNNTTTTIPSFRHLQQPVPELQQNYHTIIGNDHDTASGMITNMDQDHNLIQLTPFVDLAVSIIANTQSYESSIPQLRPRLITDTNSGQIIQVLPPLDGSSMKENIMPDSSLSADALYPRMSPYAVKKSPQEADLPPMHSMNNAAQLDQMNPYSPNVTASATIGNVTTSAPPSVSSSVSVSSSKSTPPTPPANASTTTQLQPIDENVQPRKARTKKPQQKRKRDPAVMPKSATALPSGRIQCIECGKDFTKICYFTQHYNSFHAGEMPFRCKKCGKRFPLEKTYQFHVARHEALEKDHKCIGCRKQFHHKTDLRRHHTGLHTGVRQHVCPICSKGFCRKDHLRKHIEIHNRPRPVRKTRNPAASRRNNSKSETKCSLICPDGMKANANDTMDQADEGDNSSTKIISNIVLSPPTPISNQSQTVPKLNDVKDETFSMTNESLGFI